MHPCFQNGDYPADAQNHHQNSTKSPNATAQRNVIVKVAFFASKSEAQQNSGHGARAPGNDCPPRGPPPFIQLINRILLRNINNFLGGTENGN